jgi:hypothetical protein
MKCSSHASWSHDPVRCGGVQVHAVNNNKQTEGKKSYPLSLPSLVSIQFVPGPWLAERYLVGTTGPSGVRSRTSVGKATHAAGDLSHITAILTGATSWIRAETAPREAGPSYQHVASKRPMRPRAPPEPQGDQRSGAAAGVPPEDEWYGARKRELLLSEMDDMGSRRLTADVYGVDARLARG